MVDSRCDKRIGLRSQSTGRSSQTVSGICRAVVHRNLGSQPSASIRTARLSLMRRVAFDRTTFLKEHSPDVAHCFCEQIRPLLARPEQDQIDKALAHVRHHLGQISCVVPLDVISYDIVYLAVQAVRFALLHLLSPSEHPLPQSTNRTPSL